MRHIKSLPRLVWQSIWQRQVRLNLLAMPEWANSSVPYQKLQLWSSWCLHIPCPRGRVLPIKSAAAARAAREMGERSQLPSAKGKLHAGQSPPEEWSPLIFIPNWFKRLRVKPTSPYMHCGCWFKPELHSAAFTLCSVHLCFSILYKGDEKKKKAILNKSFN